MNARAAWAVTRGAGVLVGHPDTGYTDSVELDKAAMDLERDRDFVTNDDDARDPMDPSEIPEGHGTRTGSVIIGRAGGSRRRARGTPAAAARDDERRAGAGRRRGESRGVCSPDEVRRDLDEPRRHPRHECARAGHRHCRCVRDDRHGRGGQLQLGRSRRSSGSYRSPSWRRRGIETASQSADRRRKTRPGGAPREGRRSSSAHPATAFSCPSFRSPRLRACAERRNVLRRRAPGRSSGPLAWAPRCERPASSGTARRTCSASSST